MSTDDMNEDLSRMSSEGGNIGGMQQPSGQRQHMKEYITNNINNPFKGNENENENINEIEKTNENELNKSQGIFNNLSMTMSDKLHGMKSMASNTFTTAQESALRMYHKGLNTLGLGKEHIQSLVSDPFSLFAVVPDVIATQPAHVLGLKYGGTIIESAKEMTAEQTQEQPILEYPHHNSTLYTIICCDPDAPSHDDPKWAQWLHWLCVNVPGTNIAHGDMLAEYVGPCPPAGSGWHRYCFLVFRQGERIDVRNETKLSKDNLDKRPHFHANQWISEKYETAPTLHAATFFRLNA